MAPLANPIFSFALFVALFLSISTEAREMSSFAKFSPALITSESDNNKFQQFSNDNRETDSYDPSREEENTPWYQKDSQSGQTEEKRHPDTYTPWHQKDSQSVQTEEKRHPDTYTRWNHESSRGNSDEFQYSQYNKYSDRFSESSNTKNDFYNSNPFDEEDSNVKRVEKTPNSYSQYNDDVNEAQGMSDVRRMSNGKFRYDVNDESKHGSFYKSNTLKHRDMSRDLGKTNSVNYRDVSGDVGHGHQYDSYDSKTEASLNDPERLSAYDP